MHLEIQTALNAAIANPSFSGALPPLSEDGWRKLVVSHTSETTAENDRLEFLGDALMYATIGKLLYTQCPQGSPHLYTVLRSALHSNATFSKLAEKLDVFAVSKVVLNALTAQTFGEGSLVRPKPRLAIKKTADLFEAVIGAYYMERGFEALYEWVNEIYAPLIVIAKKSFSATVLRMKKRDVHAITAIRDRPSRSLRPSPHVVRSLDTRKDSIYTGHPPLRPQPAWHGVAYVMPLPLPSEPQQALKPNFPLIPFHERPFLVPPQAPPPMPNLPSRPSFPLAVTAENLRPFLVPPNIRRTQSGFSTPSLSHNSSKQQLKPQASLRLPTPRRKGIITTARKPPSVVIDLTLDDSSPEPSRHSTPVPNPPPAMTSGSITDEEKEMDELEDMLMSNEDDVEDLDGEEMVDSDSGDEMDMLISSDDMPLTVFS